MRRTCSKCGAEYELKEIPTLMRDTDSLECDICGETLIRWNGASFWVSKLIKKPNIPSEEKHE